MNDLNYMRIALRLAERGMGLTAPNPTVGAVIVNDGVIVGRGWTAPGGRPHAETIAIQNAGDKAKGGTIYVSLEPCAHHGKTPPCAEAIVEAGIKKAVIATTDPDPRVSGKGTEILKNAGIEVVLLDCHSCEGRNLKDPHFREDDIVREAKRINAGFFLKIKEGRPFVTLKLAFTKDGKISVPKGGSNWFTGEMARNYAHLLRYRHDAILVGVDTIIADNPQLTCRLPGLEKFSPVRVILDSNFRTPKDSNVIKTAEQSPTWIVTTETHSALDTESSKTTDQVRSVETIAISENNNKISIESALEKLAEKGITRLLVEGGGKVAESFLDSGFVDQVILIQSSTAEGDKKSPNILETVKSKLGNFKETETKNLGNDKVVIFNRH